MHFVPNALSYYQCEVRTERDKQGRGNPRSVPQYAASYWCILYWENIQRQGKYVKKTTLIFLAAASYVSSNFQCLAVIKPFDLKTFPWQDG